MSEIRKTMAVGVVLALVAGLFLRLTQVSLAGKELNIDPGAPVAQAAPDEAVAPLRLEWLGGCPSAQMVVGVYYVGDGPCRPSETITLDRLERQLIAEGVLATDENLKVAPGDHKRPLICWGLVMSHNAAQGWLCSDRAGVYRVSMSNKPKGAHWQLQSDHTWRELKS